MCAKKFTNKEIKQIARTYIFTKNMTYKKLGEIYKCSDSRISCILKFELVDISRILYLLVCLKANHNKKKARKKFAARNRK